MPGSQKRYWHSRQRMEAPWAWGGECEDQLPHEAASLVQMDWGPKTHPDFRLVPPRLNWQGKGLQKLRWSPEHQLHCLVDNTFPGCVLHAPACSLREICYGQATSWVQDALCHLVQGWAPDFVSSCRDVSREREWLKNSHGSQCVIRNLLRFRQIWGLWSLNKFPVQIPAKLTFGR